MEIKLSFLRVHGFLQRRRFNERERDITDEDDVLCRYTGIRERTGQRPFHVGVEGLLSLRRGLEFGNTLVFFFLFLSLPSNRFEISALEYDTGIVARYK